MPVEVLPRVIQVKARSGPVSRPKGTCLAARSGRSAGQMYRHRVHRLRRIEAVAAGPGGKLSAVSDAELAPELLDLVLDGVRAEEEAPADLVVWQPERDELEEPRLGLDPRRAAQEIAEELPVPAPQLQVEDGGAVGDALERPRRLLAAHLEVDDRADPTGEETLQRPRCHRVGAADERNDRELRPVAVELEA